MRMYNQLPAHLFAQVSGLTLARVTQSAVYGLTPGSSLPTRSLNRVLAAQSELLTRCDPAAAAMALGSVILGSEGTWRQPTEWSLLATAEVFTGTIVMDYSAPHPVATALWLTILQDFCGSPDLTLADTRIVAKLVQAFTVEHTDSWSPAALALAEVLHRAPALTNQYVGHVIPALDIHPFHAESRTPALEWQFTVRREGDATLLSLTNAQWLQLCSFREESPHVAPIDMLRAISAT